MTFEALLQAIVRGELGVRLFQDRLRYRLQESLRPGAEGAARGEALVYALAEHHDALRDWLLADQAEKVMRPAPEKMQSRSDESHTDQRLAPPIQFSPKPLVQQVGQNTAQQTLQKTAQQPAQHFIQQSQMRWRGFSCEFSFEETLLECYRRARALPPVHHVAWVTAPTTLAPKALRWALTAWVKAHPAVAVRCAESASGGFKWSADPSLPHAWEWFRWSPAQVVDALTEACARALSAQWRSQSAGSVQSRQAVTLCLVPLSDRPVAGQIERSQAFESLGAVLDPSASGGIASAASPAFSDGPLSSDVRYGLALLCDDLMFCAASSQALAQSLSGFLLNFRENTLTPAKRSRQVLTHWQPQAWATRRGLPPSEAIQVAEQWLDAVWQGVTALSENDEPENERPKKTGTANLGPVNPKASNGFDKQAVASLPLPDRVITQLGPWAALEPRWVDLLGIAATVMVCAESEWFDDMLYWVPIYYPVQSVAAGNLEGTLEGDLEDSRAASVIGRFQGTLPIYVSPQSAKDPLTLLTVCALGMEQIYQIGPHSQSALLSLGPQSLPFSLAGLRGPSFQRLDQSVSQGGAVSAEQQAVDAPVYFRLNTTAWTVQVGGEIFDEIQPDEIRPDETIPNEGCLSGEGGETSEANRQVVAARWVAAFEQLAIALCAENDLQTLLFPGLSALERLKRRTLACVLPQSLPECPKSKALDGRPASFIDEVDEVDEVYVIALNPPHDASAEDFFDESCWREALAQVTANQPILRSVLIPGEAGAPHDEKQAPRLWGVLPTVEPDFRSLDLSDQPASDQNGLNTLLQQWAKASGEQQRTVRHVLIKTGERTFSAALLIRPGLLDRYSAFRLLKMLKQQYRVLIQRKAAGRSEPSASSAALPMALRPMPDRSFLNLLSQQVHSPPFLMALNEARGGEGAPVQHAAHRMPADQFSRLLLVAERVKLQVPEMIRALWAWCLRDEIDGASPVVIDVIQQKLAALGQPYCLGPWHAQHRYNIESDVLSADNLATLLAACKPVTLRTGRSAATVGGGAPGSARRTRFHYTRLEPYTTVGSSAASYPLDALKKGHHYPSSAVAAAHSENILPLEHMLCQFPCHRYEADLQVVETGGQLGFWLSVRETVCPAADLLNRFLAVVDSALAGQAPREWQGLLAWEQIFYEQQAEKRHPPGANESDVAPTIFARIVAQAEQQPDHPAIRQVFDHVEAMLSPITYRALLTQSMGMGKALEALGWASQPVLLYCEQPEDWISVMLALLACQAHILLPPRAEDEQGFARAISDGFSAAEAPVRVLVSTAAEEAVVAQWVPLADIVCLERLDWRPEAWSTVLEAKSAQRVDDQGAALSVLANPSVTPEQIPHEVSCTAKNTDSTEANPKRSGTHAAYTEQQWIAAAQSLAACLTKPLADEAEAPRGRPAPERSRTHADNANSESANSGSYVATLSPMCDLCFQVEWLMVLLMGRTLVAMPQPIAFAPFTQQEVVGGASAMAEAVPSITSTRDRQLPPSDVLRAWFFAGVQWAFCTSAQLFALRQEARINPRFLPRLETVAVWGDFQTHHEQMRTENACELPLEGREALGLREVQMLALIQAPHTIGPVMCERVMGRGGLDSVSPWLPDVCFEVLNSQGNWLKAGRTGALVCQTFRSSQPGRQLLLSQAMLQQKEVIPGKKASRVSITIPGLGWDNRDRSSACSLRQRDALAQKSPGKRWLNVAMLGKDLPAELGPLTDLDHLYHDLDRDAGLYSGSDNALLKAMLAPVALAGLVGVIAFVARWQRCDSLSVRVLRQRTLTDADALADSQMGSVGEQTLACACLGISLIDAPDFSGLAARIADGLSPAFFTAMTTLETSVFSDSDVIVWLPQDTREGADVRYWVSAPPTVLGLALMRSAWRDFLAHWRKAPEQPYLLPPLYAPQQLATLFRSAGVDHLQYWPAVSDFKAQQQRFDSLGAHPIAGSYQESVSCSAHSAYVLNLPNGCQAYQIDQVLAQLYEAVPVLRCVSFPSQLPGGPDVLMGCLAEPLPRLTLHGPQPPEPASADHDACQHGGGHSGEPSAMMSDLRSLIRAPLTAQFWQQQAKAQPNQLALFFDPRIFPANCCAVLVGWIASALGIRADLVQSAGEGQARTGASDTMPALNLGRYLPILAQLAVGHTALGQKGWTGPEAQGLKYWQAQFSKVGPVTTRLYPADSCAGHPDAFREAASKTELDRYCLSLSPTLADRLQRQADKINAALGINPNASNARYAAGVEPVSASDLVALAHFSCVSALFDWQQQLFVDVLRPGSDNILGLAWRGFCLPHNWSAQSVRRPLYALVGLLKGLMRIADDCSANPQLIKGLVARQRLRFVWRAEVLPGNEMGEHNPAESAVSLPSWYGLGITSALSVHCLALQNAEPLADGRQAPKLNVYVETPGWAGAAGDWAERIRMSLEALAAAENLDGPLPSPLLRQEMQCLRQALAGARRIAKWPPLLSLIEQQISRSPLAPALTLLDENLTLSYEQLSCLANWLAHSCLAEKADLAVLVCWRVSQGQAVVTLLAALKLQIPFLILENEAIPQALPAVAQSAQALWITSEPERLKRDVAEIVPQCSPVDVFHWPQAEWRDGSREDTPRSVQNDCNGDPVLTWHLSSDPITASNASTPITAITREALTNQLMTTLREVNVGPADTAWVTPDLQCAQMLQLLLGMWLFGGRVLLDAVKQEMVISGDIVSVSPAPHIHQLIARHHVSLLHLPYSVFCEVVSLDGAQAAASNLRSLRTVLLQADWLGGFQQYSHTNRVQQVRDKILRDWCQTVHGHHGDFPDILLQMEERGARLTIAQRAFSTNTNEALVDATWPRWLDNIHVQVLLPDARQAPPDVPGDLQISRPTLGIPAYLSAGERCLIRSTGEILFLAPVGNAIRHRGRPFCPAQWCRITQQALVNWLAENLEACPNLTRCAVSLCFERGFVMQLRLPPEVKHLLTMAQQHALFESVLQALPWQIWPQSIRVVY